MWSFSWHSPLQTGCVQAKSNGLCHKCSHTSGLYEPDNYRPTRWLDISQRVARKNRLQRILWNWCLPVGGSKCFQSKVGFEFANPVFPFWICLFGPFVGRIDAALNARTWNAKIAGCVYVFHGFIEKPYFLVCWWFLHPYTSWWQFSSHNPRIFAVNFPKLVCKLFIAHWYCQWHHGNPQQQLRWNMLKHISGVFPAATWWRVDWATFRKRGRNLDDARCAAYISGWGKVRHDYLRWPVKNRNGNTPSRSTKHNNHSILGKIFDIVNANYAMKKTILTQPMTIQGQPTVKRITFVFFLCEWMLNQVWAGWFCWRPFKNFNWLCQFSFFWPPRSCRTVFASTPTGPKQK